MTETISQSDREFLQHLQELGSATIPSICQVHGVTTTAVRQRLIRLQAAGLITRETVRTHRGRPHHEYRVTITGKKLLGDNYTELATVLWNQLNELTDATLKGLIVEQVRKALIQKYGRDVDAIEPAARLQQLELVLKEHGFAVEIDHSGQQLALMERSCPYHDLATQDRSICDLEQQVYGEIIGVELQLTQRCVDGHACCRFEAVGTESAGTGTSH